MLQSGWRRVARVKSSFLNKQTGRKTVVPFREPGSTQVTPVGQLNPGDLFTVGFDPKEKENVVDAEDLVVAKGLLEADSPSGV
jgi:hypothetical protein